MSRRGFTIVELLVVITIILVLVGLILTTTGYVQNKAGRSRAQSEIQALSAACENYKADNGIYPAAANSNVMSLNARIVVDPSLYKTASIALFQTLIGDTDGDGQTNSGSKVYMMFKKNQLGATDTTGNPTSTSYIADPFGNSYGYSTANASDPSLGYNPTFDLWSTAGSTTSTGQTGWVTNW